MKTLSIVFADWIRNNTADVGDLKLYFKNWEEYKLDKSYFTTTELFEIFIKDHEYPNLYEPVSFPDVQDYMEKDWFINEAILDVTSIIGDSTYLIPIKRLYK